MTEQFGKASTPVEDNLQKLRAEYWSRRLDHTLTHTQTSSRLIYLADGGVLALVYFVIQAFCAAKQIVVFASIPMFVLSLLIMTQRRWYEGIDDKLRTLLRVKSIAQDKQPRWKFWKSTHKLYASMHWVIAGASFIMAVLMFLYGFGLFPDLP